MIVEYAGELIRSNIADKRENSYKKRGMGCYMFRLDDEFIIDATVRGNIARMINHNCEPNADARLTRTNDGKAHIILYALRYIKFMEEITYDYKFAIEDASQKIPCHCGAPNCRKHLN